MNVRSPPNAATADFDPLRTFAHGMTINPEAVSRYFIGPLGSHIMDFIQSEESARVTSRVRSKLARREGLPWNCDGLECNEGSHVVQYFVKATERGVVLDVATVSAAKLAIIKFLDAREQYGRAWVSDESGQDLDIDELTRRAQAEDRSA